MHRYLLLIAALFAANFTALLVLQWLDWTQPPLALQAFGVAVFTVGVAGACARWWIWPVRRSVRYAKKAIDSTNDGYWVLDADGNFIEVNEGYCHLVGYSHDEVLTKVIADFEEVATQDRIRAQIQRIIRKGNERFETRHRHKDGHWVELEITVTAIESHFLVAFLRDISERKLAEAKIHQLAYFDALTGLPGRLHLQEKMAHMQSVEGAERHCGALMLIDLDNFKVVNDTRGHAVGDELLVLVTQRFQSALQEGDTLSRQGGDEFVVLLGNLGDHPAAAALSAQRTAEKLRLGLAQPFMLGAGQFHVSASIGVSVFVGNQVPLGEIMQRADTAMYQAKSGGRNRIELFACHMEESLALRAQLEADLHHALPLNQLQLYFQPQFGLGKVLVGAEALLRWRHPVRGMVSPLDFIPLAEESGLIQEIGAWVIESACKQLADWQTDPLTRGLQMAVNVSAAQFGSDRLMNQLRALLASGHFLPEQLKLELTESLVIEHLDRAVETMHQLLSLGIVLSMDDFGTGQSSLANLQRLPFQQIKIDQSFVSKLDANGQGNALVNTIIVMAGTMGLDVIAEGVETQAQLQSLEHMGCTKFQGFLFSRPVPAEVFDRDARLGWPCQSERP